LVGPRSIKQIFLLNLPFSGSTAMAELLLTSPRTWSCWPNAEGQWVHKVRAEMRREPWNPEVDFDWSRIRRAWLKHKPVDRSILIEKSPPNLLRVRSIMKTFPDSVYVLSNRNPYAWLSSVMYRAHRERIATADDRRAVIVRELARWLLGSRRQIENLELVSGRSVITSYEAFCAYPQILLQSLNGYCGDLKIDPRSQLRIKDYPEQSLVNMNHSQIARLTADDIALASEILARAQPVLDFFAYELLDARLAPAQKTRALEGKRT
jgi:Sulfotransferase family